MYLGCSLAVRSRHADTSISFRVSLDLAGAGKSVVSFINDIKKDTKYRVWPASTKELLTPGMETSQLGCLALAYLPGKLSRSNFPSMLLPEREIISRARI